LIQRKRGLLITGLLTAVVALAALFPARVAYKLASPPHLEISGLSGTVWNGTAQEFATNGIYLRNLEWRMRPLSLLSGKASFIVSGEPSSGFFNSGLAVSLGGGTVTLSDLSASLPLAMIARAAGVQGLKGSASLQIANMKLVAGRPAELDGSINVANLVVPLLARASLGGFRVDFFTQGDHIMASVEDTDGAVDLAGSLQINRDKSYSFRGVVIAKPNTPENLRQRIQYLPQTDQPGQHELALDGSY
jgi:general secretion pathway protein N